MSITFPLLCCSSTCGQQDTSALVQEIKKNLRQSYTYHGHDLKLQSELSGMFDSLINDLSRKEEVLNLAPQAENNLSEKILVLAQYKAQNQELFEEISEKYIHGLDNPNFRAPASPLVEPQHLTETYRLVWEYYLLKPASGAQSFQYDRRVCDALASINNQASLVSIENEYQHTLVDTTPANNENVDKRKLLLLTLAKMPSEKSIGTMLRLVEKDTEQVEEDSQIKWNSENYFQQLFSEKQNIKLMERWQEIIPKLNLDTLNPKSQQIIKRLDMN